MSIALSHSLHSPLCTSGTCGTVYGVAPPSLELTTGGGDARSFAFAGSSFLSGGGDICFTLRERDDKGGVLLVPPATNPPRLWHRDP